MRPTSIRIPDDLDRLLSDEADRTGQTVTDVIIRACRKYLESSLVERHSDAIAQALEKIVTEKFQNSEERLASLLARAAIDTATSMYLSLSVATATTGIEPAELFAEAERRGIRRVAGRGKAASARKEIEKEGE